MKHIHVHWIHEVLEDPIELYSELDSERNEIRKVEVFRDGRMGFADSAHSSAGTSLGEMPIPDLDEIAADKQFVPREISEAEFQRVWLAAIKSVPRNS